MFASRCLLLQLAAAAFSVSSASELLRQGGNGANDKAANHRVLCEEDDEGCLLDDADEPLYPAAFTCAVELEFPVIVRACCCGGCDDGVGLAGGTVARYFSAQSRI